MPGESHGPLEAVLFDMDGLLVDSEPLWLDSERDVMARLGGDWSRADQQRLVGGSLDRTTGYMLELAPDTGVSPAQVGEWLLEEMSGRLRAGVSTMPGAKELLAELADYGVPLALVTSSHRRIMDAALYSIGREHFAVTVDAQDVRAAKPDPEPYLTAAGLLGAEPTRCVVLEDSLNGVAAGEAAGCVTVAVPSIIAVPRERGRHVVASLTELDTPRLRALVAERQPPG